jgi:L-rhamnose mutarotase
MGFTMKLHAGSAAEYQQRHDAIWPELTALLRENGIRDYSIFLDEASGMLFGTLKIQDAGRLEKLAELPVMRRWWTFMKDIMETNPDHSPVSHPLREVFYME